MTTARKVSEADLQSVVIETAQHFGWLVHHCRPAQRQSGRWSTPISGNPGFPDLILARNGEILAVELKAQAGRLSTNQKDWLAALRAGVETHVWRPDDWQSGDITRRLR